MEKTAYQVESQLAYGCVFCHTGAEHLLVQEIQHLFPKVQALNVVKLRYRRVNGIPVAEKATLFPGYVFIRLPLDEPLPRLWDCRHALKVLCYPNGDWQLIGRDRELVQGLFGTDGILGFSRAYYDVGQRIHIIDGPLKAYDGRILRVNHRKQTAEVQISLQGVEMKVWLGFETLDEQDVPDTDRP